MRVRVDADHYFVTKLPPSPYAHGDAELAMEQWPDPVVAIIIADFHVNDPSDMGCH